MTVKYVPTKVLAENFGVAESTIAAMVASGDIPPGSYVRIGRIYRFDLRKVEQALLDRTTQNLEAEQLQSNFDN